MLNKSLNEQNKTHKTMKWGRATGKASREAHIKKYFEIKKKLFSIINHNKTVFVISGRNAKKLLV